MTTDLDLNPLLGRIISVLAFALLGGLVGLVAIGVAGGDAGVRMTLTHVVETIMGVFLGIAIARIGDPPREE